MDKEKELVVSFEIDDTGVTIFSTQGVYGVYPTSLFLCEIYEKLQNHFEYGKETEEFFNYQDPHGAWTLLNDYFKATDFLKNATLRGFEEYRSRYGISLDFKKGESAEIYQIFDTPGQIAAIKRFSKEFDKWRIFDKETVDKTPFIPDVFHYDSCRTMIDFVFSLVHYFVFNKYKITKCVHCGHYFAVKSLKELYCLRSSPFAGYESYSCKDAVKAIKDMLEKKRNSEYERLRLKAVEYGTNSKHYKVFNEFCSTCNEYKARLKPGASGASVELLQEYKAFLFDSGSVRPKYERLKNW